MKLLLWLVPGLLFAQTNWTAPPEFASAGYRREVREDGIVLSGPGPLGALTQTFDAAPYRGEAILLRASVRVEGGGKAQLQVRVDRAGGKLGFFDNMGDRPVTSPDWQTCALYAEVAADAESIEVGLLSSGAGPAWVKEISFEKLPASSPETSAARQAIRENYARVDAAYAAADVDAIASVAMPDAQVLLPTGRLPLSTALTGIMEQVRRGAQFRSESTVTAIRMDGAEAVAWVNNESSANAQGMLSCNRDTWVKTARGWKLKESSLIAARPMTPNDVLAEIRTRAGMPRFENARIILCDCKTAPPIEGFTVVPADVDPKAAAERALAYLREHAPEDAGPAALAFQNDNAARLAAVVRVFDAHRENTPEWMYARQAAVIVHQSVALRGRTEEAIAGQIIWFASQAYPEAKLLIPVPNAPAVAPSVRARYGKQVYVVGTVARELLGGELFLDLASVPAGSPLGKWVAAQKFPYNGLLGR